eukprot:1937-Heterococcus_DN1.PRE.4
MRQQFKPEFLNRVDEFVIFNSLGKQQMRKITALELMKVSERLRDKRITLKATDEALDFLSEVGFDPVYGARPLKRAIQREVETVMAKGMIAGKFVPGDVVQASVDNERLMLEVVAKNVEALDQSPDVLAAVAK